MVDKRYVSERNFQLHEHMKRLADAPHGRIPDLYPLKEDASEVTNKKGRTLSEIEDLLDDIEGLSMSEINGGRIKRILRIIKRKLGLIANN